jgi:hypothetical protein
MTLNLNPVMSIIANVPAAIASTVRLTIPLQISLLMYVCVDRGLSRGSPFSQFLNSWCRDVCVSSMDPHRLEIV